jgi:hypothetical protein
MSLSTTHQSICKRGPCISQVRLDEEQIDYDLLEDLITYIDELGEEFGEGAVLVFLPGIAEIQNLLDRLSASRRFGTPEKLQVSVRDRKAPLKAEDMGFKRRYRYWAQPHPANSSPLAPR